jgi:hypothetical protein
MMAALGTAISAGAAVMLLAWYRASDTVVVDDQVRWASVGLAGAMLVAVAGFVAVALLHRRMRLRFRSVTAELEPCLAGMSGTVVSGSAGPGGTGHGAVLVAAPNMRHYHRPGCPLAAGKPVRAALRADHERAGRRTCGVCAP